MENITLLVNSCDSYEDVWIPFFTSLKSMWPNFNYPILLNSEGKSFSFPGLNIETLPKDDKLKGKVEPWGKRLLRHLDAIKSEYVLVLFDDFILEGTVDGARIEQVKNWLISNDDIAAFYIVGSSTPLISDPKFPNFSQVSPNSDYIVSSAPALWNKKNLKSLIGPIDTPWAWEYFGSARAYRNKYLFYYMSNKHDEIFKYKKECGGAIHQGKWVKEVIDPAIMKYSLSLDTSIRGYDQDILARRNLRWHFNFYYTGFKMIKWDVFIFIRRAVIRNIKRLLFKKNSEASNVK